MVRFLENLLGGATNLVKRQKHEHEALGWQRVAGKITRHSTPRTGPTVLRVDYEYRLDEQGYSGTCNSFKIRSEDALRIGQALDASPVLQVRVNPDDPSQSRILNSDNPRLPFEVDHLLP